MPRQTIAALLYLIGFAANVFVTAAAHAQATLNAPAEAGSGSTVEVSWTGPGENYDSVYILKPDQSDDASGIHSTSILNKKNPLALVMPDEPGEFEIRYWSRSEKQVLARQAIILHDEPSSLDAPASAPVGSDLEVSWSGPGNSYDNITLVPNDADDAAKAMARASILRPSPVILKLPETAGEYEIRYVTRQNQRVLARRPLTIEAVAASLEGPESPKRGEVVEVTWEGPGNNYDRIEIHPADAAENARALVVVGITNRRNPVSIKVPDAPGDYELRYSTAREKKVLARRAFTIRDVETTLEAPDLALAATPLQVGWKGPGNNYDRIELVDLVDPETVLARAAILGGKNPVMLNVPDVEGSHLLRYVTTQANNILATRPIEIQPAGRLRVSFETERDITTGTIGSSGAVELVLDASGSMLKRTESGERRIEIARTVLQDIVRDYLADGQPLALRVFGHREPDSCRTDLEMPLAPLNREQVISTISGINAMNLAKTPIADSLAKVPADLAGAGGAKTIVLITDGEETCGGDPAQVITKLRKSGLDLQLSIVGFAIDDMELKASFQEWAALGGGSYFDAQSADDLLRSLRTVISGPFSVVNAEGEIAGQGIIGGADIVLPPGTYRVRMAGEPPRWIEDVVIKPRETTEASF